MSMIEPYKLLVYLGLIIFGILMLIVGIIIIRQFKERRKIAEFELPDLKHLEQERRLQEMAEKREKYDFGLEKPLEINKVAFSDDNGVDTEGIIEDKPETSVFEDFGGLLHTDGSIGDPTPDVVANDIELPQIEPIKDAKDNNEQQTNNE